MDAFVSNPDWQREPPSISMRPMEYTIPVTEFREVTLDRLPSDMAFRSLCDGSANADELVTQLAKAMSALPPTRE